MRMRSLIVSIVGVIMLCGQASVPDFETVRIAPPRDDWPALTGYWRRPPGTQAVPVVVALHGCGGVFTRSGRMQTRDRDWADRLVSWGYAVLLPDSFSPRGFRQICTLKTSERRVHPKDRAIDAQAAIAWVIGQPGVDKGRIALLGWSNGGSTVLRVVNQIDGPVPTHVKTAIAFYPGCQSIVSRQKWRARVPLTILMGSDDDWTPAQPCRALVAKHPGIAFTEYPDAVHGFDAPNTKLRVRKGLGLVLQAKVGTNPQARAAAIIEVERVLKDAFR